MPIRLNQDLPDVYSGASRSYYLKKKCFFSITYLSVINMTRAMTRDKIDNPYPT